MTDDIDWLAVSMVVREGVRLRLRADEKKMAVRRLADRMLSRDDLHWSPSSAAKLTAADVADLLCTTERSAQRLKDELPRAERQTCPVCREPMWVLDEGKVEPHPDSLMEQCVMSDRVMPPPLRGLAALRPDLYSWLEVSA